MSSLDPIKWTLEFDLANGGSGLKTATSLLGDVQKKLESVANTTNGKANDALKEFKKNLANVQNETARLNSNTSLGGLIQSFRNFASGIGLVSLAAGAGVLALQGLKVAFSALDEFTDKAVEAFSERTSALRTYTTVLGDAKAAQEEFNFVSQLAQKTEFDRAQIDAVSRKLVTSNFKDEQERRAAELTIADIASAAPLNRRQTALERSASAFSNIKGNNYIQQGDFNRFKGNLGQDLIKQQIAEILGIKRSDVDKKIHDKEVNADVAIAAIQKATLKQFGTNKLGEFAVGASGDITTLLSNQKEAEKNALLNIAPETLASYETYRQSIQDITDAMNQETQTGKNYKEDLELISEIGMAIRTFINEFKVGFLDSFGQVFNATRELLGGTGGFADVQEGIKTLGSVFKAFGFVVGLLAGVVGGVLIKAWDYLIVLARGLSIEFRFLYASLKDAGDYISDKTLDIYDGLKSIFEGLATLIKGVINLSFDTIKEGWNKLSNSSFSSRTGGKTYDEARKALSEQLSVERAEALKKATEEAKAKNKPNPDGDKDKGSGSGGGRGRGARGQSGLAVDFNAYSGPLADLAAYASARGFSSPVLPGASYVPHAINGTPNLPTIKPQIFIEKFEQNIDGGGTSPKEIADEAYTRFTQEIGRRIVRSPSPQVT